MQILKSFGCGCVGIADEESRQQFIFKRCYGDHDDPDLCISGPADKILPSNLPGEFVSPEDQKGIFDEMNRLMNLGRNFEIIQRMLGIEVKQ